MNYRSQKNGTFIIVAKKTRIVDIECISQIYKKMSSTLFNRTIIAVIVRLYIGFTIHSDSGTQKNQGSFLCFCFFCIKAIKVGTDK